jgi:hypothetical protein
MHFKELHGAMPSLNPYEIRCAVGLFEHVKQLQSVHNHRTPYQNMNKHTPIWILNCHPKIPEMQLHKQM